MKQRFRLYRREKHLRAGQSVFYLEDTQTRKRTSLRTAERTVAERLLHAQREAHAQPHLNLQIARAYLLASDAAMVTRTWEQVMEAIIGTKTAETKRRWQSAAKDRAFDLIRRKPLLETRAGDFLSISKFECVLRCARGWCWRRCCRCLWKILTLPEQPFQGSFDRLTASSFQLALPLPIFFWHFQPVSRTQPRSFSFSL